VTASDTSTSEQQQQLDEYRQQQQPHGDSRSRTNSVSRAIPYVPQSIKGRPSIRHPSSQFSAHERSIAGNVPPAFTGSVDPGTGTLVEAGSVVSSLDKASVEIASHNPVTKTIASASYERSDDSAKNNDETSFGAIDGSSARDVDVGFLKTSENSALDYSNASFFHAPDNVALSTAVKDLASRVDIADNNQTVELSSSISTTPSSRGSAQFLTASSFYGSANRHRSVSGASVSPRMGTKVRSRSPVKMLEGMTPPPPSLPIVQMTTCALNPRPGGTGISSKAKPKVSSYDHNANPISSAASRPLSPSMFGTDGSPSSLRNRRPTGDFSDEEDAPMIELGRSSLHSRFIGGGDGPELPAKIVPEMKKPSPLNTTCIIAMMVFAFFLLVGNISKYIEDEGYPIEVIPEPLEEASSIPSNKVEDDPLPQSPEETSAEMYERLKAELQSSIDKTVQSNLGIVDKEWRRSLESYGEKVAEARSGVVAITERLVNLETAVDQLKVIQNKYGADLRSLGMELKGIDAGRAVTEARLNRVDDGVERLNELVSTMTLEMETSVKAALVRLVTEVESLKATVHSSSSSSPPVNATEIAASVQELVGDMRETIFKDMERKIATKENQMEHRLRAEMRLLISSEMETLMPTLVKETEEKPEEEVAVIAARETLEETLVDYALESQGGSVVDGESSETYVDAGSTLNIFGVPVWYHVNGPRTVIGANREPGQCWPMAGSSGHLLIRLSHPILVTGFSLEHISIQESPVKSVASAPKDFDVEVFDEDFSSSSAPRLKYGPFRYEDNNSDQPVQHFGLNDTVAKETSYKIVAVRLNIRSNHGHPEYTCIYRFRVHGEYAGLE